MSYAIVSQLVQQAGTVYFVILFAVGLAYALSPKRKDEFQHAARLPLEDEEG